LPFRQVRLLLYSSERLKTRATHIQSCPGQPRKLQRGPFHRGVPCQPSYSRDCFRLCRFEDWQGWRLQASNNAEVKRVEDRRPRRPAAPSRRSRAGDDSLACTAVRAGRHDLRGALPGLEIGAGQSTLPVAVGQYGSTPHIAFSGAFLALRASGCNGWPRRWVSGRRRDWHPGRSCRIPA
jgi:hypothetical protein